MNFLFVLVPLAIFVTGAQAGTPAKAELRCPGVVVHAPQNIWFRAPSVPPKGVVLLAHGLNLEPSKMDPLAQALTAQGFQVLRIALSGHRGVEDEIKGVSRELWVSELHSAYCEARAQSLVQGAPLHFVGYSLGALVNLDLMNSHPESLLRYDRMVLFAPAAAVHPLSRLIKIFSILGRGFVVPSWANPSYRANRSGTPMAAYSALFESLDSLEENGIKQGGTPTLILIDPSDELVSKSGLQELLELHKLSQWKISDVKKAGTLAEGNYHHLIIDEPSLGPEEWTRIQTEMVRHLTSKTAR